MSQTESFGSADAARWLGVAASMVDYLQSWLRTDRKPPPVPRGIFAGASRFLKQALEGIALDRHERFDPEIPIMAGISNMTIALQVLHRLPLPPADLREAEKKFTDYLECLKSIENSQSEELVQQVEAVKTFFEELRNQGNRAQHAAFARAEFLLA
ncbi:MAG: hypothetical protein ACRELF_00075 [Gemmataceae bacterium]